jgi:ubiquinone/menaquinone biosynthesis C-methylase UbiE
MVAAAKEELKGFPNITVQKADCKNTDFPIEKFDTVFMVNVLHFIENPEKGLQESYRILKTGGLVLLIAYTALRLLRHCVYCATAMITHP